MATGGEHVTAAGEETPLRKPDQAAETELSAPEGWTKKVNPTRPGKFEVIFVAPTGEEIKTKRALTQYLKKNPGGPAVSEFNWGTGDTPRRSSRLSEKVKPAESSEDEKPAKRGRSTSSKKGKKDAEDEDEKRPAKRGRPSKKSKKEDAPAESGDDVDAEEAKVTDIDVEMKDAENAEEEKKEADSSQEEKKESATAQEEKKDAPMVDAAEKAEEAKVNTEEVSELPLGADAAEKTEEVEAEVSVLPSDVSAPVAENKGDGKPAESEVEKTENGPAIEFTGTPAVEKKEEAGSTINPATPPPVEVNTDAPAAEAAKEAEDKTSSQKDDQANSVNLDNNGQIQLGASPVKCT